MPTCWVSSDSNALIFPFDERITDQDSGEVHIWMWFRPMVFNPSWRILSHAWRKVPCTWGRWQVGEQSLAGDIGWSSAKRFTNHSYIPVVYPVICNLSFLRTLLFQPIPGSQAAPWIGCWPSPVFGDRVPWVSSFQHQPAGTSANTPSRSFKPCNALQVLWLRSEGTGSSFPRSSALRSGRCTVSCTFEMEWPWPESVQLAGVETPHQIWDPSFNGISIASLNKCLVDLYVCWILCGVDEMLITFCAASMQGDKSFSLWPWQNCKFYW